MDEVPTKKERREVRREEKEKAEMADAERERTARFLKIGGIVVTLAALGYGLFYFITSGNPEGQDFSRAVEVLPETAHVSVGTLVTDYNSDPPTSGRHWPEPAARGVHSEAKADEQMVHNLEHGEIWISYRPGISGKVSEELKEIAADFHKVVLTPREKSPSDIALAAWGRLDTFNLDGKPLPRERVEDFIKRYRNLGPELVP